jgi:peptidoglycan/xylan/chitin deacetylase (PgdA/CDA1 family)
MQIRLLFAGQLFLTALVIFLFFHYQKNDQAFPPRNTSAHPTNFPAIRNYLKNYQADFWSVKSKLPEKKNFYQHTLLLPAKKNWLINIWNNSRPVITHVTKTDSTIPFTLPLDYGNNLIRVVVFNDEQNIAFHDQYSVEYRNSQVELLRYSIEEGSPAVKQLAITFDAGSDSSFTREILRMLDKLNVRSTLFLTGKFMLRHPELVREMVQAGHEIANHTYNHPHLTSFSENGKHHLTPGITRHFIHRQLIRTDSIFYHLTGQHLKPYWRAPFGEYNQQILLWAAEVGYLHIRWTGSFDTHDWVTDESSQIYRTPDEVFNKILQAEQERPNGLNGVIMLMHLGSQRNEDHMFTILPKLVRTIRNKGYMLGCISDLLLR